MCFGKANGGETVTTINHSFKKSSNAWGRGGGICNLKTNEEVADPAYCLCNLERTLQNLHIKIEKSTCALIFFFFQSLVLFLTKIQVAIYVEEVCIIAVHLATFSL